MNDPDADIRLAAFQHLQAAMHLHGGPLPWAVLKQGFLARGRQFLYASAAEGIFRPIGMSNILSLKTVMPKPKGRMWYHDQAASELTSREDVFWYAFTGSDPTATRNRWLQQAMQAGVPLVYFFGVAPGVYEPLFPAFVVDWRPDRLSCALSFSAWSAVSLEHQTPVERRYALRAVRQRLHQAVFRERVLAAYDRRCALSGLPEPRLIDAAHIVPDTHPEYGQPEISNGICMSKIVSAVLRPRP